jgi:hypothetical protein
LAGERKAAVRRNSLHRAKHAIHGKDRRSIHGAILAGKQINKPASRNTGKSRYPACNSDVRRIEPRKNLRERKGA